MEFERNRKKRVTANIIPLIDVAMFLLIFFLVAGTVEKFEIVPVDPPIAESGKRVDEGHVIILLGSREEIVINEELITLGELRPRLASILKTNPDKVITLKADARIPAVRMIAIMDQIKLAGGKQLSLVTQSVGGLQ